MEIILTKRLERQKQFTEDILAGMIDFVRVIDKNNRIIFVNEPMKNFLGDIKGQVCYKALGKPHRCRNCISETTIKYGKIIKKKEFVGRFKKELEIPVALDTDVNAAALAEITWGMAKGLGSCIYMTVGTGIGVGAIVNGDMLHGLTHPEMGHILVKPHKDDEFEGICPFHKNCLEGLASGPAIEKRWGMTGKDIPVEHKAWKLEAYYLAQAIMTYILTLSPEKVIIGGGVSKQSHLFPLIRKYVVEMLNGYIQTDEILNDIDNYIVYPKLGDNTGICGALALAKRFVKVC